MKWLALALALGFSAGEPTRRERPPNIVLILTDDQGYGDFPFTNELVVAPHLDELRERSAWTSRFYVTPVCSTTRASLLTGRYSAATGVITNAHPMAADEVTLAEYLAAAGYATGIFGKWDLGDHFPHRPQDQGFEEVLTFVGGILRELEPEPVRVRYTNPMLLGNGEAFRAEGYATDVLFGAALEWIEGCRAAGRPFFAYLPTAALHPPLADPPQPEYDAFREGGLEHLDAAAYAMIQRIDANVGRLVARLAELGIAENTLVVFTGDNGPGNQRFNAGLRGFKSHVHEGGIRMPLLVSWPGTLEPGERDLVAAHIDLVPTLLAAVGLDAGETRLHGVDVLPVLRGDEGAGSPDRALFFQCSRHGELDLNWAVRTSVWKLVSADGYKSREPEARPELFRIAQDPGEEHDVASENPEVVRELRAAYRAWTEALRAERDLDAPPARPLLGVPGEPRVLLTREEAQPARWDVEVKKAGEYEARLRFLPLATDGRVALSVRPAPRDAEPLVVPLASGATECVVTGLRLHTGLVELRTRLFAGTELSGREAVWHVELTRVE